MLHQLLAAGSYSKPQLICVECGTPTDSLYREYSKGNIRLTRCKNCGKVVDKYVEWDSTLMFIEMMLQRKAVYRHLLYNFLPAPHLGYTAWALARVCVFLVLLEVLGRQYAYSATLGAGRSEGLRRIESANITSHSPAMAMLPFNEPKFVSDTALFTFNAFLEGTVFAVATMLCAWVLRHPRWKGNTIAAAVDATQRDRSASGSSSVDGSDGGLAAPQDPMHVDWVASRCVAGLPSKLLPWNVRRAKRRASDAAAVRVHRASDQHMPLASNAVPGVGGSKPEPVDSTALKRRLTTAKAEQPPSGDKKTPPADTHSESPTPSRRVHLVSPKDSEGNATWQFARSAVAAMILGSFGRLAAVLVVVWAYPPQFVSAIGAFVLVSHITSLGAALDVNQFTAVCIVAVGLAARLLLRAALYALDFAPDVPVL